jgi:hypothetical protein
MTTFIIDTDLNIIAFPAPEAAQDGLAQGAMSFTSQKELAKLTAAWAATRLVEVWNGFAGVVPFDDCKPVKKFTDRRRALTRIWQAIQRLTPAAHEGAREAPSPAATGEPSPKKVVPQARPVNGRRVGFTLFQPKDSLFAITEPPKIRMAVCTFEGHEHFNFERLERRFVKLKRAFDVAHTKNDMV